MSRVSISKAYAVLLGMETYKRGKAEVEHAETALGHQKDKLLHPKKVQEEEEAKRDKSESAEKERQYLEKQRGAREKGVRDPKKRCRGGLTRLVTRFTPRKASTPQPGPAVMRTG